MADARMILLKQLKYPYAKVVYLDQNQWSGLSEGHFNPKSEHADAARLAFESVKTKRAVFPLSLVNWVETAQDPNPVRRRRNGKIMTALSRGMTLLPISYVRELEILEACGRLSGDEPINLGPLVLSRGFTHMAGLGTPRVVLEGVDATTVKRINKLLAEATLDPKSFQSLVKNRLGNEAREGLLQDARRSAYEIEQVRGKVPGLTERQRYLRELGMYFSRSLLPKFIRTLENNAQALEALGKAVGDRHLFLRFFGSMPTISCFFDLETFRSGQMQRRVKPNDMLDLIALSVAMPYCHGVVTEEMWAEGARALRFKKRYDTDVVGSLEGLGSLLR